MGNSTLLLIGEAKHALKFILDNIMEYTQRTNYKIEDSESERDGILFNSIITDSNQHHMVTLILEFTTRER